MLPEDHYTEEINRILDAAILRVMTQEQFDRVNFDILLPDNWVLEDLFGTVFGHKYYFQYIILHKATEEETEYVYRFLKVTKNWGEVEQGFLQRLMEDLHFSIIAPIYPIERQVYEGVWTDGSRAEQTIIIKQRLDIGEVQALRAAQQQKVKQDMDRSQSN